MEDDSVRVNTRKQRESFSQNTTMHKCVTYKIVPFSQIYK